MNKIKSFQVDHRKLGVGIYVSRVDVDIVTYDLRFCKPNSGTVLDNVTMHTIEHMLATFARNSDIKNEVLYFGPMGCQTGFYLLVRDVVPKEKVLETIRLTRPIFPKPYYLCMCYFYVIIKHNIAKN